MLIVLTQVYNQKLYKMNLNKTENNTKLIK